MKQSKVCAAQFAVYVAYAVRLENAFLGDEMAAAQAYMQLSHFIRHNEGSQISTPAVNASGEKASTTLATLIVAQYAGSSHVSYVS